METKGEPEYKIILAQNMFADWNATTKAEQVNLYQALVAGQIDVNVFFDAYAQLMLSYEIQNNAIRQALLLQKNANEKAPELIAAANVIFSTIHSAKGLEFNNTVVSVNEDNVDEADKRMYYVAFTRAINAMHVLAYGKTASSKMNNTYEEVLAEIKNNQNATVEDEEA